MYPLTARSPAIPTLRNSLMDLMLKELPGDALHGATMSPRALKLLRPWSLYIEKHSAVRPSKNNEVSIRYLKLAIHLLQLGQYRGTIDESGDPVMSQRVNAALRLGLYFSGYKGNDLIWNFLAHHVLASELIMYHWAAPEWYTPEHCDLLLDFLVQIFRGHDYTATGNVFIVLGSLRGFPSASRRGLYVQALIHSMGSEMPAFVSHAALNAACMIRTELVSIVQDNNALQSQFSEALFSAAQVGEPTASSHPESILYKERDLCYLRLLCTLSKHDIWHDHLRQHGHFARCLTIALTLKGIQRNRVDRWYFAAYGVYIAHIFAIMDGCGVFTEPEFSQAALVYKSWPFTLEALCFIFSFTFFVAPNKHNWEVLLNTSYHEALPHLVRQAETMQNTEETRELIRLVKRVYIMLETYPVGDIEFREAGLKTRRLLYACLKAMGMGDIIRFR